MVDYLQFSELMRPLAETILNTLKMKEMDVREEVAQADQTSLARILSRQDVWFSLVQLIISAAQGLEMEDQTIQQAFMLMKCLSLRRYQGQVASSIVHDISLFEETMHGLTCLMISSKVQDSEMHLRVENVVQLLRKFLEDNQALQNSSDIPDALLRAPTLLDEQFGSRRLQNRALLERVASLEKSTISRLRFSLNVATPAEFIVVYLQLFEQKVTQIDWETIMMLRGQSLSNSYICMHVVECVLLGAQAIALASLLHVMLDWQWSDVADNFMELMQTEVPDSCTFEDVIVCQHRLQEIITRETQAAAGPPSEVNVEDKTCDAESALTIDSQEEDRKVHLTTVHEASEKTEITRLCNIAGESEDYSTGEHNFSELANSATLLFRQKKRDEFSFCHEDAQLDLSENRVANDVSQEYQVSPSYQIPDQITQTYSEVQMLNVVDEQTAETDEVDSASLLQLKSAADGNFSYDNCEVRDANDEKKEFKLAACSSQQLPVSQVHITQDELAMREQDGPLHILNISSQKNLFEHNSIVKISVGKHSPDSAVEPATAAYDAASCESADELADVAEHDQQSDGHAQRPSIHLGFIDSITSRRHNGISSSLSQPPYLGEHHHQRPQPYESCDLLRATQQQISVSMTDQVAVKQALYELDDVAAEMLPMASRNSPKLSRASFIMKETGQRGMFTKKSVNLQQEKDKSYRENTHPNSDVKQEAAIGRAAQTLAKVKHDKKRSASIAECDFQSQESSSPLKMDRRMTRYTFAEASFLTLKRLVVPINNTDLPAVVVEVSPDFKHVLSRPLSNSNSRESGLFLRTKICSQHSAVWTNQNHSFKSSLVSSGTMMGQIQPPYASTQHRRPCQPVLVPSVRSSLTGTAEKAARSGVFSVITDNNSCGIPPLLVPMQSMRQLGHDRKFSADSSIEMKGLALGGASNTAIPQFIHAIEQDDDLIRRQQTVRAPPKQQQRKKATTNQRHPVANKHYATNATVSARTNSRPLAELCPNEKLQKKQITTALTGRSKATKTQLQQYQAAGCSTTGTGGKSKVQRGAISHSNKSHTLAHTATADLPPLNPSRSRKAVRRLL